MLYEPTKTSFEHEGEHEGLLETSKLFGLKCEHEGLLEEEMPRRTCVGVSDSNYIRTSFEKKQNKEIKKDTKK